MPELARIFVDEFAPAYFVALQWKFDIWRFYFKLETKKEVPNFQFFSSQNSDLDNDQLDEIGQKAHAENSKRATGWGVKKFGNGARKKNYSRYQNRKSNGLEWNSAKGLVWSENRERPSINSKFIEYDWN